MQVRDTPVYCHWTCVNRTAEICFLKCYGAGERAQQTRALVALAEALCVQFLAPEWWPQPSVTPVLRNPMPSSDLAGTKHIHTDKTYMNLKLLFSTVTSRSVKKLREMGNVSVSTSLRETNWSVLRSKSQGNSRKGEIEEQTSSCACSVASYTYCFSSLCLCTPAGADFWRYWSDHVSPN